MYIDIEPNDNLAEACMATFNVTGPGRSVTAIHLDVDDVWVWCAVTGWEDGAPVPAVLTPIEESGDGPALLVSGGNQGLRLARLAGPDDLTVVPWDLDDAGQWAEGFLIVVPETLFR